MSFCFECGDFLEKILLCKTGRVLVYTENSKIVSVLPLTNEQIVISIDSLVEILEENGYILTKI